MSAAYRFLGWTRRGLAGGITAADTLGPLPGRVGVRVGLDLAGAAPVDGQVQLYGPGDVVGLDPRVVLRTDPRPGSVNVEPNYLALIEFDPPDLPWLFTPARSGAQGRLRPWLVLVVVRDTEGGGVTLTHDGAAPLPTLTIRAPADARRELPDLADSWAWAHAQILHDDSGTLDVPADLAGRPVANLSRLVCPRRLAPDTSYLACVVPAFDHGVRSGLGVPVGTAPAQPAWDVATDAEVRLPVYYQWRFATGPDGDIESLASALTAVQPPDLLGTVSVQLAGADPALADLDPAAPGSAILVRGALAAPPADPPVSHVLQNPRVAQVLRARIDQSRVSGELGPPLYGEWHVDVHAVPATGWLAEANEEAERRIAAGLGAAVVRARQEKLVQACWDQVGELDRANELFNRAVLSGQAAGRLIERHLAVLAPGRVAQLTRSWHDRVPPPEPDPAGLTVAGRVEQSSLPSEFLSPAYRRLAATRRPVARRAARAGLRRDRSVLDFDAGDVLGLDPAGPPVTGLDELPIAAVIPIPGPGGDGDIRVPLHVIGLPGDADADQMIALQQAASAARATPIAMSGGVGQGILQVSDELEPRTIRFEPDPDGESAARLRAVWTAVQSGVDPPPVQTVFRPAGLATLQERVMEWAGPSVAVTRRTQERLEFSGDDEDAPPFTGLQPIGDGNVPSIVQSRPRVLTPVSGLLDALPGSWLLPGLDGLPPDSATLAETNPAFVAACLLGANQELNTELLWREYPTDRLGTPLRRFWARRVPGEDVEPIHTWSRSAALADLAASTGTGQLVLVLRGQLLLRYPDMVVYAVAGDASRPHDEDPHAVVLPVFAGRISPDVSFVGFPISREQAVATQTWFVLQQQPAAPRFGFDVSRGPSDPLVSWSDVAWSDLAVEPGDHLSPESAAVAALELATGGVGAGSVASHRFGPTAAEIAAASLQRPIRVAIHASRLLPPKTEPA